MKPDHLPLNPMLIISHMGSVSTPCAPKDAGLAHSKDAEITSLTDKCRYTGAEIAASTRRGCRWIVVDSQVYDVSPLFAPGMHPGGSDVLSSVIGGDATDPFYNSHPEKGRKAMLAPYHIGTQSDWSVTAPTAAYRALRAELEASGELMAGGSFSYYGATTARVAAAAAVALGCVIGTTSASAHFLGAAALGVFWQQLAFVGHDLGHNGISGVRVTDMARGVICGPALTGISFSWWKSTHNAHHVATNSAESDPDVQHMPLLAVSSHFFESLWSTFHRKRMSFGACSRATVARQHLFFYPLMFFARWNLYFQGVARLALGERSLSASLEAAALLFFFSWMSLLVAAVGRGEETYAAAFAARIVYLLICNGVAGILHVQISVSHFSQPTIKTRATDEGVSFLQSQLAGTLNIILPPGSDFFFGGLQFQIEHHLFPRLPAEALRALQPRIKALAEAHNLSYNEATFSAANTKLYESLKSTAKAALTHGGNVQLSPIVLDALNMQG